MDVVQAVFALRVMATTIMLISIGLRAGRVFGPDTLIIAVALGMAMLASAAVLAGDRIGFACLFSFHVFSVLVFQQIYGGFPLHPVRAYRRMRGAR